ncbi:MAG: hypothetical protein ACK55Z_03110, partial [bacterium]
LRALNYHFQMANNRRSKHSWGLRAKQFNHCLPSDKMTKIRKANMTSLIQSLINFTTRKKRHFKMKKSSLAA